MMKRIPKKAHAEVMAGERWLMDNGWGLLHSGLWFKSRMWYGSLLMGMKWSRSRGQLEWKVASYLSSENCGSVGMKITDPELHLVDMHWIYGNTPEKAYDLFSRKNQHVPYHALEWWD